MSVPSDPNQTRPISCPRCQQPLQAPADQGDAPLQCGRCGCSWTVTGDKAGASTLHEESSADGSTVAAPLHDAGATLPPTPVARLAPADGGSSVRPGDGAAPQRSARRSAAAPSLRCLRCKHPFRAAPDKIGAVQKCKHCDCRFRVVRDKTGGFFVQEEAADLPSAAPESHAPAASAPGRGRWLWTAVLASLLVVAVAAGTFYLFFPSTANVVSLGKYGGIEIGSTGVKMVGVEFFQTDEGVRERLLNEPVDANPKIADLPNGADDFDDRALQRAVAQVGDYFDALMKLGAPADHIYVACSSGVLSPFNDASRERNRDRLVKAIRDKIGKEPAFIDPREEAKLAFQEIVPADEWDDAVLIDVGGYNTKGGGYVRKGTFLDFNVKMGVSGFEKSVLKAKRDDESFLDAAQRLLKTEVEKPLDEDLAAVSQLKDRKKIYFLGGVPWALASYTRPAEFYAPSRLTANSYQRRFRAADILAFNEMVCGRSPADIRAGVTSQLAGKEKEVVEAVEENLDKLQRDVFKKPDRLVGGAQILLAIDKAFAVRAEDKEIWVFRHGQVAWLLGYIKAQSGRAE